MRGGGGGRQGDEGNTSRGTMKSKNDNNDDKQDEDYPSRDFRHRQTRLIIALVVLIVCFIIAVTSGLLLNRYYNDDNGDDDKGDDVRREREGVLVDCLPHLRRMEERMRRSKEECLDRGCEWKPQKEEGAPWCVFPKAHDYVIKSSMTLDARGKRFTGTLTRSDDGIKTSGVPDVFDDVTAEVEIQTNNRLRIRLRPSSEDRWEIPASMLDIEATNDVTATSATSLCNVTFGENPFGVVVARKDTGTVVFDSRHPGTMLARQFLQITTSLPNGHVFGFGEHRHLGLRHDLNWRAWPMFTRDTGPNSDWNLYGQHPVYLNVEHDGKANMVLLKNSNAMEVLLQPEPHPAVTFTTIGGVLDFYVFVGDSPADVTSHYIKSIGLPAFPPYWSLGFHLCRWGYKNITHMRQVVQRTLDAGIPYDGQWADIDAFYNYYPFTFDPDQWNNFPAFVKELHTKHHLHFVTIVDPGVGSDASIIQEIQGSGVRALSTYDMYHSWKTRGVFVINSTGTGLEQSEVWPGPTVFPDFTNPESEDWWRQQILHYAETVGVQVDALWIDMNEPASFIPPSKMLCENNTWNYPPYCPNILGAGDDCVMYDKTICMDARQNLSLHYDVHSLYGHSMAIRTYNALSTLDLEPYKSARPWTMTRSSFVGTGRYATKWMGDNSATWQDMRNSIIAILEFGFFGFAMNGADICGFWNEPSYELCVRWHQLGAFYPFARNHNGKGDAPHFFKDQDPASFGPDFVETVRPALMARYRLLPYLYTSMYEAHTEGHLVMQPLFYQFPHDKATLDIDRQFMLGEGLLVSPVLDEGKTSVEAYFPEGRWFDYTTGEEIRSERGGTNVTLDTPLNKFNVHIRGGHVIPVQKPAVNTFESRQNELGLLVAMDESGRASGQMFWDDGQSKLEVGKYNFITFTIDKAGTLRIEPKVSKLTTGLKFDTVEIYGLTRIPANVKVNDKPLATTNWKFLSRDIIQISGINQAMTSPTTITWSMY